MHTRRFWSFFTVALMLCFLFATSSRGSEAVPVAKPCALVHIPINTFTGDNAVLKAKAHLASGWYGVSRRIQVPASFFERHTGHAHLHGFSFDWNIQQQKSIASLRYDAGDIFISRIRSLLYPKHSFW